MKLVTGDRLCTPVAAIRASAAGAVAIGTAGPIAEGQVYKCKDDTGKTVYADTPCDRGGKPLKLPGDAKEGGASPQVCAQLQDEIDRLTTVIRMLAVRSRVR